MGQMHINLPPEHPIISFETIEIKMAAVSAKRCHLSYLFRADKICHGEQSAGVVVYWELRALGAGSRIESSLRSAKLYYLQKAANLYLWL